MIFDTIAFMLLTGKVVLWTAEAVSPITILIMLSIPVLVGLAMMYRGFSSWRTARFINDTSAETAQSVAAGRVELTGTVQDHNATVEPPYTDRECVYVTTELEIKKTVTDKDGETETKWVTEHYDEVVHPFYLQDDTGKVLISADEDPEITIVDDAHSTEKHYDAGHPLPEELTEYISRSERRRSDVDDELLGVTSYSSPTVNSITRKENRQRDRRYTQSFLPVGSQAYVFGHAESQEHEGENTQQQDILEIKRDPATNIFSISDSTDEAVSGDYKRHTPLVILLGFIMSTFGLYLLLTWSYTPFAL